MANEQHQEWLLRGAQNWNARMAKAPNWFKPDLRGADLQEANLQEAKLVGAELRAANLVGADLRGADLTSANLVAADLTAANLRGADLTSANLQEAKLVRADLTGKNLVGADLRGAELQGASVRSVYSGSGTNNLGEPEYTDLTLVQNLDQLQLDVMIGDAHTRLPAGLVRPASWSDLAAHPLQGIELEESALSGEISLTAGTSGQRSAIKTNVRQNRVAIKLTGESVLEQIEAYRGRIDGNNFLEIRNPEFKRDLLGFLDSLTVNVSALQTSIPDQDADISDEEAEKTEGYLRRLLVQLKKNFAEHAGPENLADIVATTVIIGACASLGTLFLGDKGAVLGGLIGGIVTNKSRSSKDIRKATETEPKVKSDPE